MSIKIIRNDDLPISGSEEDDDDDDDDSPDIKSNRKNFYSENSDDDDDDYNSIDNDNNDNDDNENYSHDLYNEDNETSDNRLIENNDDNYYITSENKNNDIVKDYYSNNADETNLNLSHILKHDITTTNSNNNNNNNLSNNVKETASLNEKQLIKGKKDISNSSEGYYGAYMLYKKTAKHHHNNNNKNRNNNIKISVANEKKSTDTNNNNDDDNDKNEITSSININENNDDTFSETDIETQNIQTQINEKTIYDTLIQNTRHDYGIDTTVGEDSLQVNNGVSDTLYVNNSENSRLDESVENTSNNDDNNNNNDEDDDIVNEEQNKKQNSLFDYFITKYVTNSDNKVTTTTAAATTTINDGENSDDCVESNTTTYNHSKNIMNEYNYSMHDAYEKPKEVFNKPQNEINDSNKNINHVSNGGKDDDDDDDDDNNDDDDNDSVINNKNDHKKNDIPNNDYNILTIGKENDKLTTARSISCNDIKRIKQPLLMTVDSENNSYIGGGDDKFLSNAISENNFSNPVNTRFENQISPAQLSRCESVNDLIVSNIHFNILDHEEEKKEETSSKSDENQHKEHSLHQLINNVNSNIGSNIEKGLQETNMAIEDINIKLLEEQTQHLKCNTVVLALFKKRQDAIRTGVSFDNLPPLPTVDQVEHLRKTITVELMMKKLEECKKMDCVSKANTHEVNINLLTTLQENQLLCNPIFDEYAKVYHNTTITAANFINNDNDDNDDYIQSNGLAENWSLEYDVNVLGEREFDDEYEKLEFYTSFLNRLLAFKTESLYQWMLILHFLEQIVGGIIGSMTSKQDHDQTTTHRYHGDDDDDAPHNETQRKNMVPIIGNNYFLWQSGIELTFSFLDEKIQNYIKGISKDIAEIALRIGIPLIMIRWPNSFKSSNVYRSLLKRSINNISKIAIDPSLYILNHIIKDNKNNSIEKPNDTIYSKIINKLENSNFSSLHNITISKSDKMMIKTILGKDISLLHDIKKHLITYLYKNRKQLSILLIRGVSDFKRYVSLFITRHIASLSSVARDKPTSLQLRPRPRPRPRLRPRLRPRPRPRPRPSSPLPLSTRPSSLQSLELDTGTLNHKRCRKGHQYKKRKLSK
uniref:Wsv313-like protein n=1 Tax=Melicertus latisulcatus majanivirus TaxID=2984277 RepID=A0A9C7BZ66_9VIRU|nr:MAG: wsv313-like protein [Melicertus latisulcatus majanivirus]